MFNKIKSTINRLLENDRNIIKLLQENRNQSQELEWAHIFHDSIRGKKPIENLSLNIGRWAGNYSFFYVLNRILSDYKPKKILDLGLGESSKFISTFLDNYLEESYHTIVEQDVNWIEAFENRFHLSERSKIINCNLQVSQIKGFESNKYEDFGKKVTEKFDLYIVDGPFGSDRYSRYDIILLVEKFDDNEEFIIMMDDTHRQGEADTRNDIISILTSKKITYYLGEYIGNKAVSVISSEKYKFSTSL